VAGRAIRRLEGTGLAGANTVEWPLDTEAGQPCASGVYLFTLEATDLLGTKAKARGKIAVLR
jgi:hypothetical protein